MNRFKFFGSVVWAVICGLGSVEAQQKTTTDVAWFAPHKLGDAGWAKLRGVLDANHVSYTTVEFAATYLVVDPEQRDLTKRLIKELVAKDGLRIHLSDEVHPGGMVLTQTSTPK